MTAETLPRHLRLDHLDQGYVDRAFAHIARHALAEDAAPLPLTPRTNPIPVQRSSDTHRYVPRHAAPETRRPGIHRMPRPTLIEWLGTSAAQTTAATMLAAGIALQGTNMLVETSIEQRETTYSTTFDAPNLYIADDNAADTIDHSPTPTVLPTQHTVTPPRPTTPPKVATPKPSPKPKVITPTKAPVHPATTTKKPTPQVVDKWPAAGTNCNYLPKHQHKAKVTSAAQAKAIFKKMVIACFGSKEWPAAEQLWKHESNFRPMARNPHGGACGVVQSLPCSKLLKASGVRTLGDTTVEKQARWGVRYVKASYGTPSRAWRHWQASVDINGREVGHWY